MFRPAVGDIAGPGPAAADDRTRWMQDRRTPDGVELYRKAQDDSCRIGISRYATEHPGSSSARVEYTNRWFVASGDRTIRLAELVIEQTGLERLDVDGFLERRRAP